MSEYSLLDRASVGCRPVYEACGRDMAPQLKAVHLYNPGPSYILIAEHESGLDTVDWL